MSNQEIKLHLAFASLLILVGSALCCSGTDGSPPYPRTYEVPGYMCKKNDVDGHTYCGATNEGQVQACDDPSGAEEIAATYPALWKCKTRRGPCCLINHEAGVVPAPIDEDKVVDHDG